MTTLSPSLAEAKLRATGHVLVELTGAIRAAVVALHESQPGYPSGGGGPSSKGSHGDRTGELACAPHADGARRDLDDVTRLLERVCADVRDLDVVLRRWRPPSDQWRQALATEAAKASADDDRWCASCLRVGTHTPTRRPAGVLCRWCQGMASELATAMPPKWLVDRHASGARITSADVERARAEVRTPKRKR